jgi:signal transduction histidine kinase
MAEAIARSWERLDGILTGALPFVVRPFSRIGRDVRFTVILCTVLICGSFAACAVLQMRADRAHALDQASHFQQIRAADIAQAVGAALDRDAAMGRAFADSPLQYRSADLGQAAPAIRDIAVWDSSGRQIARLDATARTPLAAPAFTGDRALLAGAVAFRHRGKLVAVLFDPASLRFPGAVLGQAPQAGAPHAAVRGWPLIVNMPLNEAEALRSWTGSLPLYLFVILGPAVAGAFLAALLVGAFEAREKAARSLRALRSTRPVEARLMVRLAQAERGAAEALRSKSEFIAHMSHELRTPLNAVIGFADIIAGGLYGDPGHPKYGEYARDIGNAGRALHNRIGDILDFSNIEAGHYPLQNEAVELADLARALVDEHQGRAFSRRISLSLAFGEPGQVRADARALRRILSNLLTNALTYTGDGGIVRADVRFEDGAGVLTLTDSGLGFSAAERGRAGGPFTRFDRAGTVTGQGLGLAIAMELARRMGGGMRLASETGLGTSRGASMELRLPRL